MVTIKELAEPLAIRVLQNRLNYTCNSLSGQPIAIVAILPRSGTQISSIAIAIKLFRTQLPTPMVLQLPTPMVL